MCAGGRGPRWDVQHELTLKLPDSEVPGTGIYSGRSPRITEYEKIF